MRTFSGGEERIKEENSPGLSESGREGKKTLQTERRKFSIVHADVPRENQGSLESGCP